MQHSRRQSAPRTPHEQHHYSMHPHEAMSEVRKKYPNLKRDQIEQVHELLMYYAHGSPNGVTPEVMKTVMQHARRYHELNTGRHKLPYGDTVQKGRTE